MKILLIQNKSKNCDLSNIPKNKWYQITNQRYTLLHGAVYQIKYLDKNYLIPKHFTLTEEEWRDKQLNNILI